MIAELLFRPFPRPFSFRIHPFHIALTFQLLECSIFLALVVSLPRQIQSVASLATNSQPTVTNHSHHTFTYTEGGEPIAVGSPLTTGSDTASPSHKSLESRVD